MGWAGAEVLMAEMVKTQQKPEDLLVGPFGKVCSDTPIVPNPYPE